VNYCTLITIIILMETIKDLYSPWPDGIDGKSVPWVNLLVWG
jgi:hypothetical protein